VLDERKKLILYAAVNDYIHTGEPAASKRLVEHYSLNYSSATVRHELMILEMMGYLVQPHTSAGRVPTESGYRFYIEALAGQEGLSVVEQEAVQHAFTTLNKEIEDLMRETSQLLSQLTNYAALVFAPPLRKSVLKHIDLLFLAPESVLLVLITSTGRVAKRVINLKSKMASEDLNRVEMVLNAELSGLGFDEISKKSRVELGLFFRQQVELVELVVEQIIECLAQEEKERFYLGGTANLLTQPEFGNPEKFQAVMKVLEKGYALLRFLNEALEIKNVLVKIGSDNVALGVDNCSLVATSYQVGGEHLGTIGVLGPTRMDYARSISAVECVARSLSQALVDFHA
jgi:heat-inducible transcriptional repressor